jgi:hypothetical protein
VISGSDIDKLIEILAADLRGARPESERGGAGTPGHDTEHS